LHIANRNKLKKKDTEKKKVVQISYKFLRKEIYQETKEIRSEIEKRKSAEKNVVSKTAPDRGQKKPYRF
jgi:hypothetical protein